ncbi:carbohydrate ABC transporter permease [Cohnella fermenti]|uniref:Carbohydrate ABC transporter permease n=1 Tax=Cohnella fermenti TaxID=2565925 RepID=A0A4S4BYG7_9BACL|nr:carbohydrate ABC transporter permease [Cohnella fermenti]THF80306.1 carbohydrate ABC transporter permease [Cohnella fermenti]
MKSYGFGSRSFDVFNYIALTLLGLAILFPFYYLLNLSVSGPIAVSNHEVYLWPVDFNVESYKRVFAEPLILSAYWNSIRYTVVGTFFVMVVGCLTAYPLSTKRLLLQRPIVIMMTFTMFFSGGLIPSFLLMKGLGLLNTIWVLVVPGAFTFWNILLLRTNFQSLPEELFEAARIDGANDWHVLLRIVVPLSKPILATIALFAAVGQWNAFFGPLIFLNSDDMYPLTILLRRVLITQEVFDDAALATADPRYRLGANISIQMATIFVTVGPILLLYPFLQRYFVKGALVGSVKG